MALITDSYRDIQRQMHLKPYGGGGRRWAKLVDGMRQGQESVLDYGCGQGTLKAALPYVTEYDPAIAGKDAPPVPADIVVCTDVLEHVELECLPDVLKDLRRLTLRILFVSIATRPAKKLLPDGTNAHLIIQPAGWWKSRLRNAGFEVRNHRHPGRDWEKFGECHFKCL